MKLSADYYGNEIKIPSIGTKVLRGGFVFTVSEVMEIEDVFVIASISLKGNSGEVSVGYYDFIKHEKAN